MLACSDDTVATHPNMDSLIIEGTSSNLFFVMRGHLFTPIIDTCGVQGTMRQAVIALANEIGVVVEEGHYALRQLKNASEVFFTNSVFGILPVASISINDVLQWDFSMQGYMQDGLSAPKQNVTAQLAVTINKKLNRPEILTS